MASYESVVSAAVVIPPFAVVVAITTVSPVMVPVAFMVASPTAMILMTPTTTPSLFIVAGIASVVGPRVVWSLIYLMRLVSQTNKGEERHTVIPLGWSIIAARGWSPCAATASLITSSAENKKIIN
jgi:hypothetical protein